VSNSRLRERVIIDYRLDRDILSVDTFTRYRKALQICLGVEYNLEKIWKPLSQEGPLITKGKGCKTPILREKLEKLVNSQSR
jgi:hypothetical protein